jgi:hypothetical protein
VIPAWAAVTKADGGPVAAVVSGNSRRAASVVAQEAGVKTVKYECGCTAELHREAWVALCPKHETETKAIHERWAQEHAAHGGSTPRVIPKKVLASSDFEVPLTVGQLTSADTTLDNGESHETQSG